LFSCTADTVALSHQAASCSMGTKGLRDIIHSPCWSVCSGNASFL